MTPIPGDPISRDRNREHWLARAGRLRLPVNALWWLRTALPGLVATHAGLAAGLLIFRRQDRPLAWLFAGYGVALLATAAVAWWRARPRFLDKRDALLRLENHLGLHNRLSAALAGNATWPEPVYAPTSPYEFRPKAWLIPSALMAGLPAVAAIVPLPSPSKPPPAMAAAEPPEWKEMDRWAEELKKDDGADTEAVKRLEERLESLREENRDGMFRQGSQEATRSLHDEIHRDIAKLSENLAKAGELADALSKLADAGRNEAPSELSAAWKDALDKLQKSPLPPNSPLLAKLKEIDPAQLKKIDPKKLKLVKGKLCKTCEKCSSCVMDPEKAALLLAQCEGKGAGTGLGNAPGVGGFNQHSDGEGAAALNFTNKASELESKIETLPDAKDGEALAAGDLLAVNNRKPDTKNPPKTSGPQNGGASDFRGTGGEAVRHDRLTPEESEFLSRYNKPTEPKNQ